MERYSTRSVSLPPPHFKCASTRRLRASLHPVFSALMCFFRRGANPVTAQGVLLFPQRAGVCHWSWLWGVYGLCVWVQWNVQLYIYGLQTWPHSLLPNPSMAFTAFCRCLSMVSREHPRKQIATLSTKSALKISMTIRDGSSLIFSPKHVAARTPLVGTLMYFARLCTRWALYSA